MKQDEVVDAAHLSEWGRAQNSLDCAGTEIRPGTSSGRGGLDGSRADGPHFDLSSKYLTKYLTLCGSVDIAYAPPEGLRMISAT